MAEKAGEIVSGKHYDAVVVGSGPSGLAAAVTPARAGRSVLVLEGADTVGGELGSAKLTQPGFLHNPCSAIHPLGIASPLWRNLPLAEHGLTWIQPPAPVVHPFDDGTVVLYGAGRGCDSATPPGGGVQGMCGYWAAQAALKTG